MAGRAAAAARREDWAGAAGDRRIAAAVLHRPWAINHTCLQAFGWRGFRVFAKPAGYHGPQTSAPAQMLTAPRRAVEGRRTLGLFLTTTTTATTATTPTTAQLTLCHRQLILLLYSGCNHRSTA